jgi:tripartite-type tricarboxylate transporter receptor subunit TctC
MRLRPLAVTAAARLSYVPDVATVAESGFPGFEVSGWAAAVVPAATPKVIAERLGSELNAIVALPDVRDRLFAAGLHARGSTPDEARARIATYIEKFADAVRVSGFQPE